MNKIKENEHSNSISGNRKPFFSPLPIQTKLKVNSPGDVFEKEAEEVSEKVMRMPYDSIPIESAFQSTSPDNIPTLSSNSKEINGSSGETIPKPIKEEMERKLDNDFSEVKIHQGEKEAKLNNYIGSRAFTIGNNIFFNKNEYNPSLPEGKKLLAHELVHTVQQKKYATPDIQRDLYRTQRIPSGSKTIGPGISMRWRGNQVTITARMQVYGPRASSEVARQMKSSIETHWNNSFSGGYAVTTTADINYRDESGQEDSSRTQIYVDDLTGPSNVSRHWIVGSRYMNFDIDSDITWVPAHEFGHLLGLPDRYSEGIVSQIRGGFGGERTTEIEAGWEGNIMAQHGGVLERKNIEELLEIHASEIVTFVEDAYDDLNREFNRFEEALKRGWLPF